MRVLYIELPEGVTRVLDFIYILQISQNVENFIFRTISQIDPKINLLQNVLNTSLPFKLQNFFKNGAEQMKEDYEIEELEFDDENNDNKDDEDSNDGDDDKDKNKEKNENNENEE